MEYYRFREVLCPFCMKPYMTRIYGDYDHTVSKYGKVLNGWVSGCPKCGGSIFLVDRMHEGVDWDSCERISGFTIR